MWLLSILPIGVSYYLIEKVLIRFFYKKINFCKEYKIFRNKLQNFKTFSDLVEYENFNLGVIEPRLVIASKVEGMTMNLCF